MNELLQTITLQQLQEELKKRLLKSSHADFWNQKVLPLSEAIFSLILPLRDQGLLFNPETKKVNKLSIDEVLRWTDLVSLRNLYFILKKSNDMGYLIDTEYAKDDKYAPIDLTIIENYLHFYNVDLNNPIAEFPIRNYNLNQGIGSVLEDLMS